MTARAAAAAGSLVALIAAARPADAQTPADPQQPAAPAPSQPPPEPPARPQDPAPPLAELKDAEQIAAALSAITTDPAIQIDDPAMREYAQRLMIEGVRQLQAHNYDQALANFLEAYAKFPSPKILLNIASTLRDMGRHADAANTYQRYLTDPATGPERVAEVKEVLLRLDEQLTILTVRVSPRGSDISIDGGPFIPVGSSLLTRVRPGIHLVRIRRGDQANELTVNGFDGEHKDVKLELAASATTTAAAPVPSPPAGPGPRPAQPDPTPPGAGAGAPAAPAAADAPEHVEAWLNDSTRYGTSDATGRSRTVISNSVALPPKLPRDRDDDDLIIRTEPRIGISSGVIGVLRIDGKGRGFAGGVGLALSRRRLEVEVMWLRSDLDGAFLGTRYRLLTGWVRPYIAAGLPAFLYDQMDAAGATSKKLAIGVRGAGGVELKINGHLSVQGDVGYEHFFGVEGTRFEADVLVPTLGVIGRL